MNSQIADRIRQVRVDRFGLDGVPEIAAALGVPARTWENYESGISIPGDIMLAFLDLTGVDPSWLLRGVGTLDDASGSRFQDLMGRGNR